MEIPQQIHHCYDSFAADSVADTLQCNRFFNDAAFRHRKLYGVHASGTDCPTQLLDLQQQWNYELSDEIGWQLRSYTDCSAHTQLHCACTAF